MRRRTLLSGLALVGVSGCLRLSPDEGSAATPTEQPTASSNPDTATRTQPAANSTPSPTSSSRYPSGLTAQGVEDNLFQLHKQALGLTSFHTAFRWIDAASGGVMQDREYDVTADGALGTFTYEHGGPVSVFRSHDGSYLREDLGDRFTHGKSRQSYSLERLTWAAWIEPLITSAEWGAPSAVSADPDRWEVSATEVTEAMTLPTYYTGDYRSVTATMRVDDRNVIRSLNAEFEASRDAGGVEHDRIQYRVDSIGEVSVSQPDWLPRAKERSPQVSAALTGDRQFLRLTLEAGNPIEAATTLHVKDDVSGADLLYWLNEPIETGETVYLYLDQGEVSDDTRLELARGDRSGVDPGASFDNSYHLWAARADFATHIYFITEYRSIG